MKQLVRLAMILLVVFYITTPNSSYATGLAAPIELSGFAWSSTIGWISMNCNNTGSCGSVDYKVVVNPNSTVTGFAWSPNLGWIKFGGLSAFPTGPGTVSQDAQTAGSHPDLTFTGWARACAGTASGDCATMTTHGSGWDGWISLSGTGYDIRMDASGGVAPSFAWGSTVVGWVDFSGITYSGTPVPSTDIEIPAFSESLGSVNTLGFYDNITFNTAVTGLPAGETVGYTLMITGMPDVTGTINSNGSFSVVVPNVPFTATGATIEIDMPVPGAVLEVNEINQQTRSLTLPPPPPSIELLDIVDDQYFIRRGDSVEVEWRVSAPYDVTCELRGPGLSRTINLVGGVPGTPAVQSGVEFVANLQSTSDFVIRCNDPANTQGSAPTVSVIPDTQEI